MYSRWLRVIETRVRMPILPYFVFSGTALTLLLLVAGNEIESNTAPLFETPPMHPKKSFVPLPEPRYRITAINFAAPYPKPAMSPDTTDAKTEPVKVARALHRHEPARQAPKRWNPYRVAVYPNGLFSIH